MRSVLLIAMLFATVAPVFATVAVVSFAMLADIEAM